MVTYPCRYVDLTKFFGRLVLELCLMTNKVLDIVYENYEHSLYFCHGYYKTCNSLQMQSLTKAQHLITVGDFLMELFGLAAVLNNSKGTFIMDTKGI